jgi:dihydroorotate dehydrogenase electron transfer subunit
LLESRTNVSPTSFLLTLSVGEPFPRARPGQFISVETAPDLTLLRPFAVAGRPTPTTIEILVEMRGRGTRELSVRPPGSRMRMIGPLGNAFTPPAPGTTPVLVAGGIGVAGLRLLAQDLAAATGAPQAGERAQDGAQPPGGLTVLVGARKRELLLDGCLPFPTRTGGIEVRRATDDGSAGHRGPVTELLAQALDGEPGPVRIYCCGPPAMIESAARLAGERCVPCEALLEEMMACGVGACRGCVVETRGGHKCVCSDGPVFDVSELVFEERLRA